MSALSSHHLGDSFFASRREGPSFFTRSVRTRRFDSALLGRTNERSISGMAVRERSVRRVQWEEPVSLPGGILHDAGIVEVVGVALHADPAERSGVPLTRHARWDCHVVTWDVCPSCPTVTQNMGRGPEGLKNIRGRFFIHAGFRCFGASMFAKWVTSKSKVLLERMAHHIFPVSTPSQVHTIPFFE